MSIVTEEAQQTDMKHDVKQSRRHKVTQRLRKHEETRRTKRNRKQACLAPRKPKPKKRWDFVNKINNYPKNKNIYIYIPQSEISPFTKEQEQKEKSAATGGWKELRRDDDGDVMEAVPRRDWAWQEGGSWRHRKWVWLPK